MKLYKIIPMLIGTFVGCSSTSPQDLANLVRENGQNFVLDGKKLEWTHQMRKTLKDRTEIDVSLWDRKDEKCSRQKINVIPSYESKERHLPIGYEVVDWGCDGMNSDSDDFRIYLGNDRWHHVSAQKMTIDETFDNVPRVGMKEMYQELVDQIYKELK
ncbi:hypothetical protein J4230_02190 [Candidatus Woesearchaeota archaeon]|nr:hypothetical protein [Candidatus Woesearchaeota archaeon]